MTDRSVPALTFAEASICGLIFGILAYITAISGQYIVSSLQLTVLASNIASYEAAVILFQDRYCDLPGSYNKAEDFGANNGDGSGTLSGQTKDAVLFWSHLIKSGIAIVKTRNDIGVSVTGHYMLIEANSDGLWIIFSDNETNHTISDSWAKKIKQALINRDINYKDSRLMVKIC